MTDFPQPCRTPHVPATEPPADPVWITARAEALLSHWAHMMPKDEPDAVYRMRMADWRAILGDLPEAAIEAACLRWLSETHLLPKPKDIRALAKSFIFHAPRLTAAEVKQITGEPEKVVHLSAARARDIANDGKPVPKLVRKVIEAMEAREASDV